MSSRIIQAEYLHYSDSAINSDKVFNIFLVEEDNETYSCISEYGRRGTNLVRVFVCSNQSRSVTERAFRKKLDAKRNHRKTPYWDSPYGAEQSPFAKEMFSRLVLMRQTSSPKAAAPSKTRKEAADRRMRTRGILNQGQIDSLEI